MWRIKSLLSILFVTFFLTGSAAEETSQYLDTEILGKESTQIYEKYTVTYGTYTEPVGMVKGMMNDYVSEPVAAEVNAGTMKALNVDDFWGYHGEGDPLIQVKTEVDEAKILEARLELQRLTERYARDSQEFLQQREKDIFKNDQIGDKYEFAAGCILLERDVLEWENTARLYEQQIEVARERLQTLEQAAALTFVSAPSYGFYTMGSWFEGYKEPVCSGLEIKDGDLIGYYFKFGPRYYVLENDGSYRYGMELTWDMKVQHSGDTEAEEGSTGRVINAMPDDLYGNLDVKDGKYYSNVYDGVYFGLEVEEELMRGEDVTVEYGKGIPSGNLSEMEKVLLVPKEAVTEENDVCYVTVVKEDGSFLKTGFIAGGSNSDYYWVLEGLSEGTEILVGGK